VTGRIGRRIVITAIAALVLHVGGCTNQQDDGAAGSDDRISPATRPARDPTSEPAAPSVPPAGPDESWSGVLSNDGAYYVAYRPDPDPIPLNEVFDIDVRIFDGDDHAKAVDDVTLDVDGRMPQHRHGMNRLPEVTRNTDGSWTVTGMLFHMPGRWELYFDITRGGVTERAQVAVNLD
jgi:hypothetical protein